MNMVGVITEWTDTFDSQDQQNWNMMSHAWFPKTSPNLTETTLSGSLNQISGLGSAFLVWGFFF